MRIANCSKNWAHSPSKSNQRPQRGNGVPVPDPEEFHTNASLWSHGPLCLLPRRTDKIMQVTNDLVWMPINNRVFVSCKALLTYVSSRCPEWTAVSFVTTCHSSVCAYLSEPVRLKIPQVQGSSLSHSCLPQGSKSLASRKNSTCLFYKEVNHLIKLNKNNHNTDKPHVASGRSTMFQLLYFSLTVKQMLLSNYLIFFFLSNN